MFHTKGYNSVGINDILDVTGIPKGSFYYYFGSKEDLIQQSVMYYMTKVATWTAMFPTTVDGLRDFFRMQFDIIEKSDYKEGCPIGSMTSELAGHDEEVRDELRMVERHVTDYVKHSLLNSFNFSEARATEYATFILFSFQGAVMKAKLERDSFAINMFDKFVFELMLRRDMRDNLRRNVMRVAEGSQGM